MTARALSLTGNLMWMKVIAGLGHMDYLLANGITITACSVLNLLVKAGLCSQGIGANSVHVVVCLALD